MQSRGMRVLVAVVAALVALAIGAAIVSTLRPAADLPAGSPERTVQDYVRAVFAEDQGAAAALLDPDEGCTEDDLDQVWVDRDSRVVLLESRVDGDTATVRIEFVHQDGGPIGADEWSEQETFRLRRDGGDWLLTGPPWPLHRCLESEGTP